MSIPWGGLIRWTWYGGLFVVLMWRLWKMPKRKGWAPEPPPKE